MADPGFPARHMTTTTTSNTRVQTNLRYDPSYVIHRKEGILKIIQILLSLMGFICIQCSSLAIIIPGKYFSTVSMFGFWITGILTLLYLFHIVEKFYKIPWIQFELFYCAILALNFLIASGVVLPVDAGAFKAAGIFGLGAMVAYGFDAYLKFVAMKSGALAQGERQISKETTTVTRPAY